MYSRAVIAQEFRSIVEGQLRMNAEKLPGSATLFGLGVDFEGLLDIIDTVECHFRLRGGRRILSGTLTIDEIISTLEHMIQSEENAEASSVMAEGAD
jgi:hypothetical protein